VSVVIGTNEDGCVVIDIFTSIYHFSRRNMKLDVHSVVVIFIFL